MAAYSHGCAVAQVGEDLARPAVDAAVVADEHGDRVGAGERLQPLALLRPGLDLPGDEVDAQLGQHLAHGRGERAPLGLPEREDAVSHRSRSCGGCRRRTACCPSRRSGRARPGRPRRARSRRPQGRGRRRGASSGPFSDARTSRLALARRLCALGRRARSAPDGQRATVASTSSARRRVDLDPRAARRVEHLRQRADARLGVEAEARLPLDDDLVRRVLLRDRVARRRHRATVAARSKLTATSSPVLRRDRLDANSQSSR